MPASNSLLDQARSDYGKAQANPQVTRLAAGELKQASESLDRANIALSKGDDENLVTHLAYVAKQQTAIAQETAKQKAAESTVASATAERDRVRLNARTREADSAQRSAESAKRDAEASQRETVRERQAANDAGPVAAVAVLQTRDAENRSAKLEMQLQELQAKKTKRGMVITLGDVLFDTNRSELKSGGARNLQKLADFFKEYHRARRRHAATHAPDRSPVETERPRKVCLCPIRRARGGTEYRPGRQHFLAGAEQQVRR